MLNIMIMSIEDKSVSQTCKRNCAVNSFCICLFKSPVRRNRSDDLTVSTVNMQLEIAIIICINKDFFVAFSIRVNIDERERIREIIFSSIFSYIFFDIRRFCCFCTLYIIFSLWFRFIFKLIFVFIRMIIFM